MLRRGLEIRKLERCKRRGKRRNCRDCWNHGKCGECVKCGNFDKHGEFRRGWNRGTRKDGRKPKKHRHIKKTNAHDVVKLNSLEGGSAKLWKFGGSGAREW